MSNSDNEFEELDAAFIEDVKTKSEPDSQSKPKDIPYKWSTLIFMFFVAVILVASSIFIFKTMSDKSIEIATLNNKVVSLNKKRNILHAEYDKKQKKILAMQSTIEKLNMKISRLSKEITNKSNMLSGNFKKDDIVNAIASSASIKPHVISPKTIVTPSKKHLVSAIKKDAPHSNNIHVEVHKDTGAHMTAERSHEGWVANIYSETSMELALKMGKRLRSYGYHHIEYVHVIVHSRNWYRVRIVGFKSKSSALHTVKNMKKHNVNDAWVQYTGRPV